VKEQQIYHKENNKITQKIICKYDQILHTKVVVSTTISFYNVYKVVMELRGHFSKVLILAPIFASESTTMHHFEIMKSKIQHHI